MGSPERIVEFPIRRPRFDNTHLGNPLAWITDNIQSLARYWKAAIQVTPGDTSDEELGRWLMCQYEIEVLTAPKLPHGDSL